MQFLALVVALGGTALGVPVRAPGVAGARLAAVSSIEQIDLPRVATTRVIVVVVDPLGRRIELRTPAAAALAAVLAPAPGGICPVIEARAGAVVLRCRTRHIDAELVDRAGGRVLEIRELRGLPLKGADHLLDVSYVSLVTGGADGCPGTTPAERGECAYAAHATSDAWLQFRLALDTPQRPWAALRLGDLALRARDVAGALAFYLRAGRTTPFGRMAVARICEIAGDCLGEEDADGWNGAGLPEPLAGELRLRRARADAFAGRIASVVHGIDATLAAGGREGFCDRLGQRFCRRLVVEALERAEGELGKEALSTYLTLPRRSEGALAVELARAAADRAGSMGAPIFGANLLASVFRSVRAEDVDDFLGRAAELYLMGEDRVRAGVIVDYAETRLTARQLEGPRWRALRAALLGGTPGDAAARADSDVTREARFEELATGVTRDVAAAFGILARARAARP